MDRELYRRSKGDPFNPNASLWHYSVREIEVDGIFRRAINDPHRSEMVSIKNDNYNIPDPGGYIYEHDGWPIDERHYLDTGCIRSLDPERVRTDIDQDIPYSRMNCWCDALAKV